MTKEQSKLSSKERKKFERDNRIKLEIEKLEQMQHKFDSDPNMHKDTRENTPRDIAIEEIELQKSIIAKLQSIEDIPDIPGTWNIGDMLYLTYKRVFAYGKDLDVPKQRMKCELVDEFDITTLAEGTTPQSLDVVPLAINSALGKAILHKAHTSLRLETNNGFCEVELERSLI